MTRLSLSGVLAWLAMAACSSTSSTTQEVDECDVNALQACRAASGCDGQRICEIDGTWGECFCDGDDTSSTASSSGGNPTSGNESTSNSGGTAAGGSEGSEATTSGNSGGSGTTDATGGSGGEQATGGSAGTSGREGTGGADATGGAGGTAGSSGSAGTGGSEATGGAGGSGGSTSGSGGGGGSGGGLTEACTQSFEAPCELNTCGATFVGGTCGQACGMEDYLVASGSFSIGLPENVTTVEVPFISEGPNPTPATMSFENREFATLGSVNSSPCGTPAETMVQFSVGVPIHSISITAPAENAVYLGSMRLTP